MKVAELREQRKAVAEKANQILVKAETEKRDLTGEELQEWNKMHADIDALKSKIDIAEKQEAVNADVSAVRNEKGIGREQKVEVRTETPEQAQLRAWIHFVKTGEVRADGLLTGGTTDGGYIAPATPSSQFVDYLKNYTPIRSAPITVYQTSGGNDIPMPIVDDLSNTGDTTAEAEAVADDNDPAFGQVILKAWNYDSSCVKISKQLLQDSVIPIEQILNQKLAERIAMKENADYTTGNGTTAPQGITIASSSSGVSLPASTLGADAEEVYQNIQAIIHSVPYVYRKRPGFGLMFADSTLLVLKQLVDSQKRPVWVPSMASSQPDTICGVPYWINDDMPDIGAGNRCIVCGDFSQFCVRDVAGVEVLRLIERFALERQVGFMAWHRTDSRVLNTHALVYAANAAS